jgi:hypothetical protein
MIWLKFFIKDNEVESWKKSEGYTISSILMILKRAQGYKNGKEITKKTHLDPSFLRIKLCWKSETEYQELLCILNGIAKIYTDTKPVLYYKGTCVLDFVEKFGSLRYIPYYQWEEEKTLMWFTVEKTIERWIKGKF